MLIVCSGYDIVQSTRRCIERLDMSTCATGHFFSCRLVAQEAPLVFLTGNLPDRMARPCCESSRWWEHWWSSPRAIWLPLLYVMIYDPHGQVHSKIRLVHPTMALELIYGNVFTTARSYRLENFLYDFSDLLTEGYEVANWSPRSTLFIPVLYSTMHWGFMRRDPGLAWTIAEVWAVLSIVTGLVSNQQRQGIPLLELR